MGSVEGQKLLNAHREVVRVKGDEAIRDWIDEQTVRSVVGTFIGAQTASRPWVKYEVQRAWTRNFLGIRIHGTFVNGSADVEGRSIL